MELLIILGIIGLIFSGQIFKMGEKNNSLIWILHYITVPMLEF